MSSELRALRVSRGLSQAALAERVGVSRQAYSAIESGGARPSVDIALRLARTLETTVEALFEPAPADQQIIMAELVGAPATWPAPVRVAEVGGRTLAYPIRAAGGVGIGLVDGVAVPDDDGRVRVSLLPSRPKPPDLVVVGCDPAFALVAESLRRERGVEVLWIQAGSRAALDAVARGEAHVAGVHLPDPETGVYNEPWVTRLLPGAASLIHFATWEQTLLVAPGNPLAIHEPADLARPGVRLVNRESGTGTRALLDAWLEGAAVPSDAISGYQSTRAGGHLEVAAAVAAGTADAGVAIRAAGLLFGLETRLLAPEPYDLVVPRTALDLPAMHALTEVLRGRSLQRHVEALGGYDASRMGQQA